MGGLASLGVGDIAKITAGEAALPDETGKARADRDGLLTLTKKRIQEGTIQIPKTVKTSEDERAKILEAVKQLKTRRADPGTSAQEKREISQGLSNLNSEIFKFLRESKPSDLPNKEARDSLGDIRREAV